MNENKLTPIISNNQPIGILDSGVGGLSIAKAVTQQLPHENLIYVADTLHSPYGNKSVNFIQQRINDISQSLITRKHIKALVIACNTATVNGIDQLRQLIEIPIIGVEPAIKPAAQKSVSQNIGILVTQATAENERFNKLVKQHSHTAKVHIQPCPGLVEIIERRDVNSDNCQQLLNQYIQPLLAMEIDTLVLGCTHYPFLKDQINAITKNTIDIIDTATPVAAQLKRRLNALSILSKQTKPANHEFFSTANSPHQQQLFNDLWHAKVLLQDF